jgi:hypothetical protein
MASWDELRLELDRQPNDNAKLAWLNQTLVASLRSVAGLQNGANVIFYASGFLQKPAAPAWTTMMTTEDLNGLMAVLHGMDCTKPLLLVMHTPGGDPGAANAMVPYLHAKFPLIESIVPTYAMSAGTMVCLGTDRIMMGKQSQLGPIDAQLGWGNRTVSAGEVIDTFNRASTDIANNNAKAHLWHPILQSMGPSLVSQARNALDYGEQMVAGWLANRMFKDQAEPLKMAASVAAHFNDTSVHKHHGRRIDRDQARALGVYIDELEQNQDLQDAVLTTYHVASLYFSVTKAVKFMANDAGKLWLKNLA